MPTYEILLTAWLYLSPVIYPIDLIPESVRAWLRFNPIVLFLDIFRGVLLQGELPQGSDVLLAIIVSFLTLIGGWWVFTRRAREYAYRI
jgi:ABC-type polysaccharide/polyol phosphate export permease